MKNLIVILLLIFLMSCGGQNTLVPEPTTPKSDTPELKQKPYTFTPIEATGYLYWSGDIMPDGSFLYKAAMIVISTKRIKNVNGVEIVFLDKDIERLSKNGMTLIVFPYENEAEEEKLQKIARESMQHKQYKVLLYEEIDDKELIGAYKYKAIFIGEK